MAGSLGVLTDVVSRTSSLPSALSRHTVLLSSDGVSSGRLYITSEEPSHFEVVRTAGYFSPLAFTVASRTVSEFNLYTSAGLSGPPIEIVSAVCFTMSVVDGGKRCFA